MGAPRLIAPTTVSGGIPTAGAGTLNTVALWTPDGFTLGNSILTQAGSTISSTGTFLTADGSTANPAYAFTGSSGTGMSRGASGAILRFSASGSFAFGVSSTQKVIFGGTASTTPTQLIDVRGASAFLNAGTDGTYGDIMFIGASTYPTTYLHKISASVSATSTQALLKFSLNSGTSSFTDVMTLRGDGNVGIGTSTPTQRLRVEGAVLVAGAATLGATASAGTLSMESTVFRQYTGDGTGWTWAIAKRTGSVTTDMMYITDSGGSLYVPGADSFFFGVRVGRGGGNQTSNTAVGASALVVNVGGTNNTAVGSSALSSNVSGSNNTALGSAAGSGGTGSSNTYIGFATASGGASSGNDNTLIGAIAGNQITSGSNNVCIGSNAGQSQTVANDCTYVGKNAGYFFSGSSNTAVGRSAMTGASFATSTGTNNSAFGTQAGVSLTSGSSNVLLGWGAGNTLTTGSQNICIGVSATPAAATNSNTLVIGSSANWVATQGAATTYFTTATALSTGTLPATCGFMRVYLNGSWVKIPVYAD